MAFRACVRLPFANVQKWVAVLHDKSHGRTQQPESAFPRDWRTPILLLDERLLAFCSMRSLTRRLFALVCLIRGIREQHLDGLFGHGN